MTCLSVLFRCDGSPEIGLGHVVRCLALADELAQAHGCRVAFAMRQGPLGHELVRAGGYVVFTPPGVELPFNYSEWLEGIANQVQARALVLDVRDDLLAQAVGRLREGGLLIATIDDPSVRRLEADLAFYPPVPQAKRLDWTSFSGQSHVGWEWVVLRREFAHPPARVYHDRPVVLVTMGGSDPAGLTLRAVAALDRLSGDFDALVVLGPGYSHNGELADLLTATRRHFCLRRDVSDMCGLMAQVDLAVASFGVTAYELAAMGVPAIYLCLTRDHAESASAFVEAGMADSLGVYTEVAAETLAGRVGTLLADAPRRARMGQRARRLVDGRGAERVAHMVVERMRIVND